MFNYLNVSFSFTSSRTKGNLFKKKYVQKKHFVWEEENNCEGEINLTPQDRIVNIIWCKCGCDCKPMETFAESFCLLLWLKSRSARGASHHSAFMENCRTINHSCQPYLPNTRVSLFVPGVTEQNEDAG